MNESLAELVLRLRVERGWTQEELADRAGLNQPTIADIERGRSKLPGPEIRRKLAAALGLRHVDLLIAAGQLLPGEVASVAPRWPSDDPARVRLYEMVESLPAGALAYTLRTLGLIRDSRW